MRTSIASALALALALPPRAAHAGDWSPEQQATMQQIIALRNRGALDDAVALAQQAFGRTDASKGFRRAIAREGKAAAIKLFERDQATPRAAAAVAALCVAVDLMRTYQGELIESENDRLKIPPEVTRLEALATTAAAPCAPAPTPPPAQPTVVAVEPAKPVPALEGPASPPVPLGSGRSRVRVGVGVGLVTVGVGLLAGTTVALAGRHRYDDKIAALNALAAQENRYLTEAEMADSVAWDARYVQLEKTAAVLGGIAAVSVVAAILVLALPRRPHRSQARVRPLGAGVHIEF